MAAAASSSATSSSSTPPAPATATVVKAITTAFSAAAASTSTTKQPQFVHLCGSSEACQTIVAALQHSATTTTSYPSGVFHIDPHAIQTSLGTILQ